VETFSAPRRLTAWVRGLRAKQTDVETEVTGPAQVRGLRFCRRADTRRQRALPRSSVFTSTTST